MQGPLLLQGVQCSWSCSTRVIRAWLCCPPQASGVQCVHASCIKHYVARVGWPLSRFISMWWPCARMHIYMHSVRGHWVTLSSLAQCFFVQQIFLMLSGLFQTGPFVVPALKNCLKTIEWKVPRTHSHKQQRKQFSLLRVT